MENQLLLSYLTWIGAICGSLVMILLLASILFGLENDLDGDTDSFGSVKSILTFLSIACFTARSFLIASKWSIIQIVIFSILAGVIAVIVLSIVFKLLLKNQEDGTWQIQNAVHKEGEVYMPIVDNGFGKVTILVDGTNREIEAKSYDGKSIATQEKVIVLDVIDDQLIVAKTNIQDNSK